ncbi:MAG: ASKHA domain-containing protein [Planctomycetota bacterium]|jgi:uncharacterized 2Fe-2S/4Fe-4S cluster protein (DUF4445 family)
MKRFNVTFKPDNKQVLAHGGETLFEAAGRAGIILNSACGGKGTCRKCLMIVAPQGRQVLACQHRVQEDLTVTIPAAARFFEHRILTEGIDADRPVRPDIYNKYVAKASDGNVFGVAVDIGTTTVVAVLVDMTNGQQVATCADLNPQSQYGDDVVSRMSYAQDDAKLAELHNIIVTRVNELIGRLCQQAGIEAQQIYEVSVVGNTTMNHIFLKLPVKQLGQAPYQAFSLDAHDVGADELGLQISAAGNVHTVENIAGFVGSDITAVALATAIDDADDLTLAIDIGTNGELVLGTGEKLYAASCAAGPAFEGARITCGSRATEGAIEAVFVNDDDIDLDIIGGGPPHSICGSGLIDAVAVMLNLGVIDSTGRFVEPEELAERLPPAILARLVERDDQPAFILAQDRDSDARQVFLNQRDIRQVQLAKAAIRAGTRLLQKKIGATDDDIQHILLAGAFGNYIRAESALRIGLLPEVPVERIRFVGNAAATGARMILLSQAARENARELARKIQYIEIAHTPDFADIFAEAMTF